jgi:hypothetical protein
MFTRLTAAILAVVLAATVIALAADPAWNLWSDLAYATAGEH